MHKTELHGATSQDIKNPLVKWVAPTRRTSGIASYVWAHRRRHLLTVGVSCASVFFFAICLEIWWGTLVERFFTWQFWEPTLQLSILIIACAVWWGEVAQDWENDLPRRLTVWFLYPALSAETVGCTVENEGPADALGQVAMLCEEAYLAHEGDIRAWGQSIGLQMSKGPLSFAPNIAQTPRRQTWREGFGPFLHYHVLFRLTDVPMERGRAPDERFVSRRLLRWERRCPQPAWEDGAWVVETPNGWELVRTAAPTVPGKEQ